MSKIVVIGAGIGGLAVAALLAKDGHKVTLLEKNSSLGGRAMQTKVDDIAFDMGPSWYFMSEVFDKFFLLFNAKSSDFYNLIKLNPTYKIFFDDGEIIEITNDVTKTAELFESIEKGAGKNLQKYLSESKRRYELSINHFLNSPYLRLTDVLQKNIQQAGRELGVRAILQNLDSYQKKYFKNPRILTILQFSSVFLGINPKKAPSIYSLMNHIDIADGVYYPEGGMIKIVNALETLNNKYNVKIIKNANVLNIDVIDSIANSVSFSKDNEITKLDADIVISNADYPFTETKLLDSKYCTYKKSYWESKTVTPSALIFYVVLDKKIKQLSHHNLMLHDGWIADYYKSSGWPDKFTYDVTVTTKTDVISPNKEGLTILMPITTNIKDLKSKREEYFDKIITDLEHKLKINIKSHIIKSESLCKSDYETLYNSYKGSAIGLSNSVLQSTIFRPKMKSKKVKNLYYTGQYTNPGIGVPMVLMSAMLCQNLIKLDAKK